MLKQKKPSIYGRRLVLSRLEQNRWDKAYNYYLNEGYPTEIASERAWDHYYIDRSVAKGTFRSKF